MSQDSQGAPRVFSAVKAVIMRGGKFLLLKQNLANGFVWDLPGGKVDYGESPYDTLFREVREETNLEVAILKPLGMWWFFRTDKNQVVCNTFLCAPKDSPVDITKNPVAENITEFVWVTKEEFLSGNYPIGNASLAELIKRIEQ